MEKLTMNDAGIRLASLVIFRGILSDSVVAAFRALLDAEDEPTRKRVDLYSGFANLLLAAGCNWSAYLLDKLLCDENQYVIRLTGENEIPSALRRMLETELKALEAVGQMTSRQIEEEIGCGIKLAGWDTSPLDFTARYEERMKRIHETGYGIFAEHHMFLLKESELLPVLHPDSVDFDKLTGYERERETVTANTLALLAGKPAANVLLYGDSGTGKSTCVKAVANELAGCGLRLIELRKDQLDMIPMLIDRLSGNPLKFILFIDDLSFTQNSDNFSALKAVLEGSVSAKTANIVIYATSNRRHLIRESFSGRDGDDVHLRDTLEELGSLSERFGLLVTFLRPDRELYFAIVEQYLRRYVSIPFDDEVRRQAEAFAIKRGGRSARTARQFAESVASHNSKLPEETI